MKYFLLLILSVISACAQNVPAPIAEGDLGSLPLCVINLRNNNSKIASWPELKKFLDSDDSNQHKYVENEYDCKHFGLELFRRAQIQGITAFLVIINFDDNKEAHVLVEFPTTDNDTIYADFTPIISGGTQGASKAINYIAAGRERIQVPLQQIPLDFTNTSSFFTSYQAKQEDLKKAQQLINESSTELSSLEGKLAHQKSLNKTKTVLHRIDLLEKEVASKTEQVNAARLVYHEYAAKYLSPFAVDAAGTVRYITRY